MKVRYKIDMDRHYLIILVTAFLLNTMYGLAAPFLPALLEDNGVGASWTGLIFGIYPISATVLSLITGKCVDKAGHKNLLSLGALTMTASIFSFAAAIEFNKPEIIIAYLLLLRAVQGKLPGWWRVSGQIFILQTTTSSKLRSFKLQL